MFLGKKPYTFDRVVRLAIAGALILGGIRLLAYLADVLVPFAAALLLAYLINPLVVRVQRKVPNRSAAVAISLFAVFAVLAVLAGVLIPILVAEARQMGTLFRDLLTDSELARRAADRLPENLWEAVQDLARRKDVQEFLGSGDFLKTAEAAASKLLPGVWGVLTGALSLLLGFMGLFVVVLYLVFLLVDYDRFKTGWKEIIPPEFREDVGTFVRDVDEAMNRYFRAQAIVAAIVGVGFAIGFWLIGLPMGVFFGLFVGVLNMVPYLQNVALVPAALLAGVAALESGSSFWLMLLLVGIVFAVVQTLQDAVLVPRIMGKVTGLSPAVILLSLSVWGKLLGMLGLLIAIPVTCLLWAYYQRFMATGCILAAPGPEPPVSDKAAAAGDGEGTGPARAASRGTPPKSGDAGH
jgi:predicted PurR-regulated permease PerM